MAVKSKRIRLSPRERSKLRIRKRIVGTEERPRISVFKSDKHTYAQVIEDVSGLTLVSASSKEVVASGKSEGSSKSLSAARKAGALLAERAKAKGIESVVFDRNGYVYHGRIKALADGARDGGLKF